MTTPRITVAMSVFDTARFLAPAIESILAQSFSDFEFLIVDDGSRDESGAIIESFAARDPRIRMLRQPNRGLIASLNRLIDEARAPLIARMDGDDIALPERFAKQIARFEAEPALGMLGTGERRIDENGAPHSNSFTNVTTHDEIVADLPNGPPFCHPSMMIRTELMRAVGGYRGAFVHCEDYDLWLRLSQHARMANLAERLILYRQTASQVSTRHALAQQTGAAIAWEAHVERLAGRRDPIDGLAALPPLDALDAVFGRDGVTRAVRARVARSILYSREAIRDGGLDLIIDDVRDGGTRDGLWRTVVRLVTLGEPVRALQLATVLAIG